jgi:hypothetical protein
MLGIVLLEVVKIGETYIVRLILTVLQLAVPLPLCIFSLGIIPTRYHEEQDASESTEQGSLSEEAPPPTVFPEHQDGDIQRTLTRGNSHLLAQEESGNPHGL